MAWPQPHEYNEAIQNPALCFGDPDLRLSQPATSSSGLPIPISGNFAVVYQVKSPANGQTWAVKCFTRELPGLRDRYRKISAHLRQFNLFYTVDFQYLDPGIRIQRQWFPVLKMGWAAGSPLNRFVESSVDQPQWLEALGQLWVSMSRDLRKGQIAHADLQHGNVLLVPEKTGRSLKLKLVDYDGMFVPSLVGAPSSERGHPNYQHPDRIRNGTYSAEVDRFSVLVIYTALQCLAFGGRTLWNRYDNGENLLFRETDFQAPGSSQLFQELWKQGGRARDLVGHLMLASCGRIDSVPLLEDIAGNGNVHSLTATQRTQVESMLAAGVSRTQPVPRRTVPVSPPATQPASSPSPSRSPSTRQRRPRSRSAPVSTTPAQPPYTPIPPPTLPNMGWGNPWGNANEQMGWLWVFILAQAVWPMIMFFLMFSRGCH